MSPGTPGYKNNYGSLREAAKKVLYLVVGPLRGGGGANGCATNEKKNLFFNVRKKKTYFLMKGKSFYGQNSQGGGGAKYLSRRATKKRILFVAPLMTTWPSEYTLSQFILPSKLCTSRKQGNYVIVKFSFTLGLICSFF